MVYWVDNPTAVAVKPKKDLVHSAVTKWFNDQLGVTPTIPRAEWFNMIQSEMLSIADALGVKPDKLNDAQIGAALKLVLVKVDGIPELTDVLGTSKVLAASQFLVNTVNAKIPALTSTLSDSTTLAATIKVVNDVNRKAVNAETIGINADAKAVKAQKKAEEVPTPVQDKILIGQNGNVYKLISTDELAALLNIKYEQTTGNKKDVSMSQYATTKAITDKRVFEQTSIEVVSPGDAWIVLDAKKARNTTAKIIANDRGLSTEINHADTIYVNRNPLFNGFLAPQTFPKKVSKLMGTWYTNESTYEIKICVTGILPNGVFGKIEIEGIGEVSRTGAISSSGFNGGVFAVIPAGAKYLISGFTSITNSVEYN